MSTPHRTENPSQSTYARNKEKEKTEGKQKEAQKKNTGGTHLPLDTIFKF